MFSRSFYGYPSSFKKNSCFSVVNSLYMAINHNCRTTRIDSIRSVSAKRPNSSEYCVNLVRRCDYENYLCTLLLPDTIRSTAFSIRAFNVEIAQVQDMVSNKTIGQMRLQFWKETVEKVFSGNPPQHPVALELSRVLKSKKLSKLWFYRLIESRENRLSGQPFIDVNDLERYSENSVSPVYYLILEGLGVRNVDSDHVSSHVGKAQGITNLIRSIAISARNARLCLPFDLLTKHSVSQEDILRGTERDKLRDLIYDVASKAHQHVKLVTTLTCSGGKVYETESSERNADRVFAIGRESAQTEAQNKIVSLLSCSF